MLKGFLQFKLQFNNVPNELTYTLLSFQIRSYFTNRFS